MTKHARLVTVLIVFILAVGLIYALTSNRRAPIRLGIVEWPGFYPAVCAVSRGDFKKSGLDVELKVYPDNPSLNAAMMNAEVDIIGGTLTDVLLINSAKKIARVFAVADQSAEGDALVGQSAIKSPQDLRGKVVSFEKINSFSHMFILQYLKKFGIAETDVRFRDVSYTEVPKMLQSGEIDAGHTWDPYKAEALKNGFRLIGSAADVPGAIMDIFAYRGVAFEGRAEDVATFAKHVFGVNADWSKQEDDCVRAVAAYHNKKPSEIVESYPGVVHMTSQDQDRWLSSGTSDEMSVRGIGEFIAGELRKRGQLVSVPDFDFMVDSSPSRRLTK